MAPMSTFDVWPYMFDAEKDSTYDPDYIMLDKFLAGIQEKNDDSSTQVYSASWANKPYASVCGDADVWRNFKPSWGKDSIPCDVLEVPVKTADDAATEFALKTCRFPARKFEDKLYAQEDGHLNDIDLRNMCLMGKSYLKEIANNSRSLAYMNSNFDTVVPESPRPQSPLLLFYGLKTIDRAKVIYPMLMNDIMRDRSIVNGEECSAAITDRQSTVSNSFESMRNTYLSTAIEALRENAFNDGVEIIKDANRNVAHKCFPIYNKESDGRFSLRLDTIAGNIFQIATVPATNYDEFKEWLTQGENEAAFEQKGLAAFHDSSCRNARSIGYKMCRSLPRGVISDAVLQNELYKPCGYGMKNYPKEAGDITDSITALKKGWGEEAKKLIDDVKPLGERNVRPCNNAKTVIKNLVDNVNERITNNPALGSEGISCARLKGDMGCGEFIEIILPPVPEFEPGPDQLIKSYVYDRMLGNRGQTSAPINCHETDWLADWNENPNPKTRLFNQVCGLGGGAWPVIEDIRKMLESPTTRTDLAKTYGFELSVPADSPCASLSSDEDKLYCHILSKVVPEVCGSVDDIFQVCSGYSKQ